MLKNIIIIIFELVWNYVLGVDLIWVIPTYILLYLFDLNF